MEAGSCISSLLVEKYVIRFLMITQAKIVMRKSVFSCKETDGLFVYNAAKMQ